MYDSLKPILEAELKAAKENGTYRLERVLESPQGREITVGGRKYLNFCANNYLGLSGTKLMEKASEEAVLYSSCFMANLGLFQTFFGDQDAIISDELNHASVIDAIRLTKSERLVFKHMDMADL